MSKLADQVNAIVQECMALDETEQEHQTAEKLSALLDACTLNPTGDDPIPEDDLVIENMNSLPGGIQKALNDFHETLQLLVAARTALTTEAHEELDEAIRQLTLDGFLNDYLVDKFRIPKNREFLVKGLQNAQTAWQMAMVANWALTPEGIDKLSKSTWANHFPELDLARLIIRVSKKLRFEHVPSLRDYRKNAMHHYPKLSDGEFTQLQTDHWKDVIDLPSGRPQDHDIPYITPFVKQGDIEYSLYRHYLMPDLAMYMREQVPPISENYQLGDRDIDILFSLPIVIQQIQEELFNHVKSAVAGMVHQWADKQSADSGSDIASALQIANTIWDYRRTPAAEECSGPVENLVKGFTATIRNAFSHFSDINIAASHGCQLDPLDVSEKFILFASVSNGQLDNLAEAHGNYIQAEQNPANWDNENFFRHFLEVNRESGLQHIQAHFVVDKTRGCPAIPQIPRFHSIVLDLVLDFVLREFGEDNLRQAGGWYYREKTPGNFH